METGSLQKICFFLYDCQSVVCYMETAALARLPITVLYHPLHRIFNSPSNNYNSLVPQAYMYYEACASLMELV